jgi:hypothetical protein
MRLRSIVAPSRSAAKHMAEHKPNNTPIDVTPSEGNIPDEALSGTNGRKVLTNNRLI